MSEKKLQAEVEDLREKVQTLSESAAQASEGTSMNDAGALGFFFVKRLDGAHFSTSSHTNSLSLRKTSKICKYLLKICKYLLKICKYLLKFASIY